MLLFCICGFCTKRLHASICIISQIWAVIPFQCHSCAKWNIPSIEGSIDIYKSGSTHLHNKMVSLVPLISLDMNIQSVCFYMHIKITFCHQYVWQHMCQWRRYWADHFTVQASRAWLIDINQALNQLHILLGPQMVLKWNNCPNLRYAYWFM